MQENEAFQLLSHPVTNSQDIPILHSIQHAFSCGANMIDFNSFTTITERFGIPDRLIFRSPRRKNGANTPSMTLEEFNAKAQRRRDAKVGRAMPCLVSISASRH